MTKSHPESKEEKSQRIMKEQVKGCQHNWVKADEDMFVCGGKELSKDCFYCTKCLDIKPTPSKKIKPIELPDIDWSKSDRELNHWIIEVTEKLNSLEQSK